jgi:Ca2+-binding RTX toxin-like protein
MAKFVGTPGDDVLPGAGSDDTGNDFLYGYGGSDTLNGGAGQDNLYGGDGDDFLYGGEGDDNLQGGSGLDTMVGGLGNDTYVVDGITDRVIESSGEGNDTVKSYLTDYRLTANVENLYLMLNGAQNGKGNDLGNAIKGNDFVNKVNSYGGNDTVFGYGGDDFINPGTGRDTVDGGTGTDAATFRVDATHGVTVDLSASTNFLGAGQVTYDYGAGVQDILYIRNVENLEGTFFDDVLSGDTGNNKILALDGTDFIRGRAGNDDMYGGIGNDTFRFEARGAANGVDIVHDYNVGDTLQFYASDGYDPTAGFTVGKMAVGAGPQFVYVNNREIYYDADGAGGAAMVKITAVLGDVLTASGISIVNDTGIVSA